MDSHEGCSVACLPDRLTCLPYLPACRCDRQAYDFSMSVHDDISTFMNLKEFAAIHEIDGQKVPCVVTSSSKKDAPQDGVFTRSNVLLIRSEYVKRAEPDMTFRLDGVTYLIADAKLLQGELWRIDLGVYDG